MEYFATFNVLKHPKAAMTIHQLIWQFEAVMFIFWWLSLVIVVIGCVFNKYIGESIWETTEEQMRISYEHLK